MNNNVIAGIVAILLIVVSFYSGMKYGVSTVSNGGKAGGTAYNGRQGGSGFGTGAQGTNTRRGGASGGGFVSGDVLSNDGTILSVKLATGGSKLVLFASSTMITRNTVGSREDLKIGETIMVTGTANTDGSVTAQSIRVGRDNQRPIMGAGTSN